MTREKKTNGHTHCVCVSLHQNQHLVEREIVKKQTKQREGSTTTTAAAGGTAFFMYLKNKLERKGHFGLL